jgi:hypothetical protein
MGEAKRKRAKANKVRKMTKKTVKQHHISTTFQRKELAWLCNQYAYGNIGPKK